VTLNLKKPRAIEIAKELVKVSDIVIENMRPGVISRLGLGYEELEKVKEDLIYLSSSACGQTGPQREYIGYAPTFASMAGLPHITGYEDWPPSNFMGSIDLRSATTSAFAILAALLYRQRSGKGQYMDLSSQETIAVLCGDVFMDYIMNQRVQIRKGNRDTSMAPHNCYRCAGEDSWISIAVSDDEEWRALCQTIGRPELIHDERFSERNARWENQDELDPIISEWTKDKIDSHVMSLLQDAGVAAAPSMSAEALYNDPHLRQREVFMEVDHPVIGKDRVVAPPWKLSETPAQIHSHAPLLGQNNEDIFCGLLGMAPGEIKALEEEKVIY
jgi:benzylsuccinate CoA-transferase BbsF subunit